MSIINANRAIPSDLNTLRMLVRPIIQRFISQINEERISYRKIGNKVGISHEAARTIINNPGKKLSRKTMTKLVRSYTRERSESTNHKNHAPKPWCAK
jgi:hypothetical protein